MLHLHRSSSLMTYVLLIACAIGPRIVLSAEKASLPQSFGSTLQSCEKSFVEKMRKAVHDPNPWSPAPIMWKGCMGFLSACIFVADPLGDAINKGVKATRDYFDYEKKFFTALSDALSTSLANQQSTFVEGAMPRTSIYNARGKGPELAKIFPSGFDPKTDLIFTFEPSAHSIAHIGNTMLDSRGDGNFIVREAKTVKLGLLAKVSLPPEVIANLKESIGDGEGLIRYRARSCQHAELAILLKGGIMPAGGANISGLKNFKAIVNRGFEDGSGQLFPSEVVYVGNFDDEVAPDLPALLSEVYRSIQGMEFNFLTQTVNEYGVSKDDAMEYFGHFNKRIARLNRIDHSAFGFGLANVFMHTMTANVKQTYGIDGNKLLSLVASDFEGVDPELIRQELLKGLNESVKKIEDSRRRPWDDMGKLIQP